MRMPSLMLSSVAVQAARALVPLAVSSALALSSVAGTWLLLYAPAKERVRQTQDAYYAGRRAQVDLERTRQREEDLKVLWREVPVRKDFPALVLAISDMAKNEHLSIPGITYAFKAMEDGLVLKAFMNFRVSGDYGAIRRFLQRLESTGPSLLVESLDVSRSTGEKMPVGSVVLNIRLGTFLKPDVVGLGGT